jgi:ribosome-associated protein
MNASRRPIVIPPAALRFRTSRSSGPGGQNVNKLDTRVEAVIDIDLLPGLSADDRFRIRQIVRHRLNADGHLSIVSQRSRSQWQNRQLALQRAIELIEAALQPRAPRVPTRPTAGSKKKRVESKRRRSAVKVHRRRPSGDEN